MADTKISNLPLNPAPVGTDVLPIASGGVTDKITLKSMWDAGDSRYISPVFTYDVNDNLTRIDYADTSYKIFTYALGKLDQIDFHIFGLATIKRKTFFYSGDTLTNIVETIV